MAKEIEVSDDLYDRLQAHREEGESIEDFIQELLNIYESSRFLQEGYSE